VTAQGRARPVARKAVQGNAGRRSHRRNVTARDCRGLRLIGQPLLAGIPQINWTCSPCMAAAGSGRSGKSDASKWRCLALHDSAGLWFRGPKPFCTCICASGRIEPWSLAKDGSWLTRGAPLAGRLGRWVETIFFRHQTPFRRIEPISAPSPRSYLWLIGVHFVCLCAIATMARYLPLCADASVCSSFVERAS
jgi:hypothetical protein